MYSVKPLFRHVEELVSREDEEAQRDEDEDREGVYPVDYPQDPWPDRDLVELSIYLTALRLKNPMPMKSITPASIRRPSGISIAAKGTRPKPET